MTTIAKLPASLSTADARQQDFGFLTDEGGTKVNSLGMGVLSDGTPFLTQRGLAVLCGVENAHIGTISSQWDEELEKPRIRKIREIIESHGSAIESPHIELKIGGRVIFGYREELCLAVLEYYAFEAGQFKQDEALKHYRLLAGRGLKEIIYQALGYSPEQKLDKRWQPYLDRVSQVHNAVPQGYFSIFREISEMVVTLGENGVFMDDGIIPDISVGKAWGARWSDQDLDGKFGERQKYVHNYPDYFPQSVSNPQHPWCYPDEALAYFRNWFQTEYVRGGKFQNYLESQARQSKITNDTAKLAIEAYRPSLIGEQS